MPALQSWIAIEKDSPFSLANIPFGIIALPSDPAPRPAVAIGRYALDLKQFADAGGFVALPPVADYHLAVFSSPTLNGFAALGREVHRAVRSYLQDVLADDTQHPDLLKNNARLRQAALVPLDTVQMRLPLAVGDYTDFYAGRHHAYNVGVLFRGAQNALQPNYDYLPVAYHGRASSVVVSGTALRRPWGQQILPDPNAAAPKVPALAPCAKLDYEVELAAFICQENELGVPVAVREAESFLFGYVLMIDWSARDIQAWEYVPLGPFTSKNFGTSISPWVVLADALEPFKTAGLSNDKQLSAYLREDNDGDEKKAQGNVFNIDLEVDVICECQTTPHPPVFGLQKLLACLAYFVPCKDVKTDTEFLCLLCPTAQHPAATPRPSPRQTPSTFSGRSRR